MRFDLYLPSTALRPYIRHLAISESEAEQAYPVFPDTSLVLGFQYAGRLAYLTDSQEVPLSAFGVTGLQDSVRTFKNTVNTATVLVYFTETGAAHFFRQPVHELFLESLSLDHFFPAATLEELGEKLTQASTDEQRISVVEHFLFEQLQLLPPDRLVEAAVHRIYQSKGRIRMLDLANSLNSSPSAFEKRFRRVVGASPKKFATIVRFQSLLEQYPLVKDAAELGYLAGYYDQAHFIKDFKRFTGCTPEQFFRSRSKNDFLQSWPDGKENLCALTIR
ncbi:AraC family transcriptional regulator [Siphonobacter sp. BAB-5385]|uniref:helix-turn-helix domain-containing protein n=1 Tax=Siphonobacter sp. BAB-5385 TaxID=1864822 RepID=UPI000B9EB2F5|nr:helix-turn-helix domain-containing protein [Siphonobacter sp. BAB-5385]OZI06576.1 AraC family transcriptional regulator [Siphonobacter sp. BAB-5385]